MTPAELVELMKSHDDSGYLGGVYGQAGAADESDLGNGHYTERWGKVPLNDPQLIDVLAFLGERSGAKVSGYFTPVGSSGNLPTVVVFAHSSGRKLQIECSGLARDPNTYIAYIEAFFGHEAVLPLDVYPGLEKRMEQKVGPPMDLAKPWDKMGPRCYHPSSLDDPIKYPPYGFGDPKASEYRTENAEVYRVTERMVTPGGLFGGGTKARVWQMVNW